MGRERFITCAEANNIDVVSYLAKLGIEPVKIMNNDFWYLSPLRHEKHASFKVNRRINRWYDFGIGKGGTFIDLAILLHDCSIAELLRSLNEAVPTARLPYQIESISSNSSIAVTKERMIVSSALLQYLERRRIPITLADRFLKEIVFSLHGKQYYALGFKNNSGGWEIRNAYFKSSTSPKDSTLIVQGSNVLAVFEGVFDFLSFLVLCPDEEVNMDFLILNSLSFFESRLSLMKGYDRVNLFLDHDGPGENTTLFAKSISPAFIDASSFYKGYKDSNEYLCNNPISTGFP